LRDREPAIRQATSTALPLIDPKVTSKPAP
jgi:hypothetical protein